MTTDTLGISGVLSGWDEYSTDTTPSAAGPVPAPYTLKELLDLIRSVKDRIDPEQIERLFLFIEDHIHDNNNPHQIDLEALDTSVLEELYAEWLNRGHVGTLEEFASVIFQYIQIANDEESLAGTSTTKIISVRGSKLIYEDHIVDPDAHYHMFRAMMPGEPMNVMPTFSAQAFLGDNDIVALRRVWVELINSNTNFANWVDGSPVDYTVTNSNGTNTATEHVDGLHFVSSSENGFSISRTIGVVGDKDYEWQIRKSDHISGKICYQIQDLTNDALLVDYTEVPNSDTNGLFRISYHTPIDCLSVSLILVPALNITTTELVTKMTENGLECITEEGIIKTVEPPTAKTTESGLECVTEDGIVKTVEGSIQQGTFTTDTNYVVNSWACSKIPSAGANMTDSCYYHKPTGYLGVVPHDKIAIDHVYGDPMYSIWGERTNLIPHSATFLTGSFIGGYKTIHTSEHSPLGIYDGSLFVDAFDNTTSTHGWVSEQYTFVEGLTYTFSIYVRPLNKKFFCINLPTALAGVQPVYSLIEHGVKFTPTGYDTTSNAGEAIILPNRFVRVISSFTAKTSMTASIQALFVDIIDGDLTYIGNGGLAGVLWQAQLEAGIGASPVILTDGAAITRVATEAYIPFSDKFTENNGTLVVTTKKPYKLTPTDDMYLYDMGTQTQHVMLGRYPVTHEQKLFMESVNKYLVMLSYTWSGDALRELTTYVHSYSPTEHVYGNTGNMPIVKELTDNSVTPAELADYILGELLSSQVITGEQVISIDFDNLIRSSKLGINDLLPQQILDIVLSSLYVNERELRNTSDIVAVSIMDENALSEQITLNNICDNLWIGCNRNGTNQLNGYVKDITYYSKGSTYMNAEYHIGEYVDA